MKPPRAPHPQPAPGRTTDERPDDDDDNGDDAELTEDGVVLPIDGTLDLHTFRPDEVRELLPDYISECLAREIRELRIIHGKGRGILRAHVRKILGRDPRVESIRNADESAGSFGATLVTLRREIPRRD